MKPEIRSPYDWERWAAEPASPYCSKALFGIQSGGVLELRALDVRNQKEKRRQTVISRRYQFEQDEKGRPVRSILIEEKSIQVRARGRSAAIGAAYGLSVQRNVELIPRERFHCR